VDEDGNGQAHAAPVARSVVAFAGAVVLIASSRGSAIVVAAAVATVVTSGVAARATGVLVEGSFGDVLVLAGDLVRLRGGARSFGWGGFVVDRQIGNAFRLRRFGGQRRFRLVRIERGGEGNALDVAAGRLVGGERGLAEGTLDGLGEDVGR
jgi:hypothetical protein